MLNNIIKIKDVNLLDCTFAKNSVLLVRERRHFDADGLERYSADVLTLCTYNRNAKDKERLYLNALKNTLKMFVAEFEYINELNQKFTGLGVQTRSQITPFLSSNVIYLTDESGLITDKIKSELAWNKTALKVRVSNTIVFSRRNFRATLFNHAKLVLAQSTYYTSVNGKYEELDVLDQRDKERTIKEAKKQIADAKAKAKTKAKTRVSAKVSA